MAIKRCPYCRALISDGDQYCKNCGTQLLFPEDEDLEEEIPGDRIVEDDLEDEESEEELRESDWEEKGEGEEEEGLTEVGEGEEDTEEVILVDEKQTTESQIKSKTSGTEEFGNKKASSEEILYGPGESELPFERGKTEKLRRSDEIQTDTTGEDVVKKIEKEIFSEKEEKEEKDSQPPSARHPGLVTQVVEELKKKEELSSDRPEERTKPGLVTQMVEELGVEEKRMGKDVYESESKKESASIKESFELAELDEVGPTVEVGQSKVEDFFKVLEEKERDYLKDKSRLKGTEEPETAEVPSWIEEVKASSSERLNEEDTAAVSKLKPEKIKTETDEFDLDEEPSTEATIGFPEKLTWEPEQFAGKKDLTGEKYMEPEEELAEKSETEDYTFGETSEMFMDRSAESSQKGQGTNRMLQPMGFKNFIKAKIFDLLFLIMFWLISIWLVARSMQTNIFKLMGVASSSLLIYLLILTFVYFFLFYFFLGETLGDRLFREGEEDSLSTRSQG